MRIYIYYPNTEFERFIYSGYWFTKPYSEYRSHPVNFKLCVQSKWLSIRKPNSGNRSCHWQVEPIWHNNVYHLSNIRLSGQVYKSDIVRTINNKNISTLIISRIIMPMIIHYISEKLTTNSFMASTGKEIGWKCIK